MLHTCMPCRRDCVRAHRGLERGGGRQQEQDIHAVERLRQGVRFLEVAEDRLVPLLDQSRCLVGIADECPELDTWLAF